MRSCMWDVHSGVMSRWKHSHHGTTLCTMSHSVGYLRSPASSGSHHTSTMCHGVTAPWAERGMGHKCSCMTPILAGEVSKRIVVSLQYVAF